MTLARLLAAALLLCSLSAFAQDQQSQSSSPPAGRITVHYRKGPSGGAFLFPLKLNSSATPTDPWRIIPRQPALSSGESLLDGARLDQYRLAQMKGDPRFRSFEQDALNTETVCYAIRSYVVARDSESSDSTHPVSYSTCQPAARYQLKTTEMRSVTPDR